MKLLKQISLYFQEGRSDKVYEVDLCEVAANQYVVNFRYGRRGTALRDGTKTPSPVSLAEAERIYNGAVSDKTSKGYLIAEGRVPDKPPSSPEPPPINMAAMQHRLGPREQAVMARLARGHDPTASWPLSRAVWRAGEMRLAEAEPLLINFVGTGDPMLDYCLAAALCRCGSERSEPALRRLQGKRQSPAHVRRMAAEALRGVLRGEALSRVMAGFAEQLPPPLREAATHGGAEKFEQALQDHLQQHPDNRGSLVLDVIYLLDNEFVRPAMLNFMRTTPLAPPFFQRFRHILKHAEVRGDGEVLAIVDRRIETTRSTFAMYGSYYYQHSRQQRPTVGPGATAAFSHNTRHYLRKRMWRALRRLGEVGSADYPRIAASILLQYNDEDAKPARTATRFEWSGVRRGGFRTITMHWDRFAAYLAFNHILYDNSPRYELDSGEKYFRCTLGFEPGAPHPDEREEAFPHLWEAAPGEIVRLLLDSRCEPVHHFAARALRDCREYCRGLEVATLLAFLHSSYEETAELGYQLAVDRYQPTDPDQELVLAVADCRLEHARKQAHQWIAVQRSHFFADHDFVARLLTSHWADTRAMARDSLRMVTFTEGAAQAVIGRLFALIDDLGPDDALIAADVRDTLLTAFGPRLTRVSPEVIRDLLRHPLSPVQQFAGELVLRHETLSQHPPAEVLEALLSASDPSVRAMGVRIIGNLPDDSLKQSVDLLVALTRHELPDIREAIRPIVKRLASGDAGFGRRIAVKLVDALLVPGAPEGVPSHTSLVLREDLREHLAEISAATVWKLLESRSPPAQELGGVLLSTNVSVGDVSVREIVRLADHEIFSVRESAWRMCRDHTERLISQMEDTVRLADSRWQDSRRFAFDLFREQFADFDWTPELLVTLCDSVRPEVQQFGREMITRQFRKEQGPEILVRLSEHPSTAVQLFASTLLVEHAGNSLERLRELVPYFVTVLSRVNQGRVAKQRVWKFLTLRSKESEEAAKVLAHVFTRISATCAIGDRENALAAMASIQSRYPNIPLPIRRKPLETRG